MRFGAFPTAIIMAIVEVNIKEGMPFCDVAIKRLHLEISNAYAKGYKCIKIVHGYGSSGKGGAIKKAVLKELKMLKDKDKITAFVSGENLNPFSEEGRKVILACYEVTKDKDYAKSNMGITVVVL